jgi:uncharacterized protein YndB with AHSA1/START domain
VTEQETTPGHVPDVRKSITVPVSADQAFGIFTERPAEWLPTGHTFIAGPRSVTMEPRVGGRFYERGADGVEVTRGTILEWAPPHRLVVTWRIGPNWEPVFDDEQASRIEVDFVATGANTTEVVVTNTQLYRHGEIARHIRSALDRPGSGETLRKYAAVVTRYAAAT